MTDKVDRRQTKTRQALRKALIELIDEKGLNNITVTDITTRADVNRGTFYLHYQDAPDMLRKIQEEVFESVIALLQQIDIVEVIQYAEKDQAYPKAVRVFEEFLRNKDYFQVIFGPKGDPSYGRRIMEIMRGHFASRLAHWQPNDENMLVPREFLIAYISSANLGVVTHWITTGMQQSPGEVGLFMVRLMNHGPLTSTGLRGIPSRSQ